MIAQSLGSSNRITIPWVEPGWKRNHAVFEAAGVPFKEHVLVGQPGPTIARLAHEIGCHMIIMGTHSLESRTGAVIGSVAQSTLEHAGVPVLMVK